MIICVKRIKLYYNIEITIEIINLDSNPESNFKLFDFLQISWHFYASVSLFENENTYITFFTWLLRKIINIECLTLFLVHGFYFYYNFVVLSSFQCSTTNLFILYAYIMQPKAYQKLTFNVSKRNGKH